MTIGSYTFKIIFSNLIKLYFSAYTWMFNMPPHFTFTKLKLEDMFIHIIWELCKFLHILSCSINAGDQLRIQW